MAHGTNIRACLTTIIPRQAFARSWRYWPCWRYWRVRTQARPVEECDSAFVGNQCGNEHFGLDSGQRICAVRCTTYCSFCRHIPENASIESTPIFCYSPWNCRPRLSYCQASLRPCPRPHVPMGMGSFHFGFGWQWTGQGIARYGLRMAFLCALGGLGRPVRL